MSRLSFRSVELTNRNSDSGAVLAFTDDRLAAVLTCLGAEHGSCAGRWFVEALFCDAVAPIRRTFATLAEFEAFASERFGLGLAEG